MIGALVLLVLAMALAWWALQPRAIDDLRGWLDRHDLRLNPGFAANFRPGAVIKVREHDQEGGLRPLARPLLMLSAERCFPGKSPAPAAFPMPRLTGQRAAGLKGLGLPARAVAAVSGTQRWRMRFTGPRLHGFSLDGLDGRFSAECIERLERLFNTGTEPAMLATVVEVLVVDALSIRVQRRGGFAGGAEPAALEDAGASGPRVEIRAGGAGERVLDVNEPVVVAYRARPMAPVWSEVDTREAE